ncbi:MAG: relaxase/mobilization nuclease domain-containing protein [Emcibacteraceae bacterium]|nr:relaxase/mobilization nuclease domain-containing protein [Emcibacteraceae bacterium]
MILKGNSRGGAKNLALHLMKEENEHVEVHEIRGFMSQTVMGALNEMYAISRATKCDQFMYHCSFSPPPNEIVSIEDYEAAFDETEKRLGLEGQSRVVVFHEKEGRRHAHVVWSRIDTKEMKAINMSFDRRKLITYSRELFLKHKWKMPRGLILSEERDPRNFTLAEWQQAKRAGKDPRDIQASFEDAWAISDSKAGFIHAMEERGYVVAKGDKKGRIVAVDFHGGVYSIPRQLKMLKMTIEHVRARLGDEQELQSVDQAKHKIANDMLPVLKACKDELKTRANHQKEDLSHERENLVENQRSDRKEFIHGLKQRSHKENLARQARFRGGFKGIWDR